ncbi:MAG: hypothetical protein ACE5H9_21460, partial [Anaerolineae bacterium]
MVPLLSIVGVKQDKNESPRRKERQAFLNFAFFLGVLGVLAVQKSLQRITTPKRGTTEFQQPFELDTGIVISSSGRSHSPTLK